MVLRVKITKGVADGQFLLCRGEDVLALGRMVHCGVIRLRFGQGIRNTLTQFILEFFECHISLFYFLFISKIVNTPHTLGTFNNRIDQPTDLIQCIHCKLMVKHTVPPS